MVRDRYPWVVGILALVYAGWVVSSGLLAQSTHLGWAHHNQKVAVLSKQHDVTGLIFGGSNASFSLSAKKMSELTGEKWFNASLMNEGFSFENQAEFVNDVAAALDPNAVRTVVLSSIRHIQGGRTDKLFSTGIARDGEKTPPLWLPYSSLAGLIVEPVGVPYGQLVTDEGDLIHAATRECAPRTGSARVVWADGDRIDDMLDTWLPLLGETFPNASIAITIPAQYLTTDIPSEDTEAYVARLNSRIDAWKEGHPGAVTSPISVIVEPNLGDRSLVCSTSHHLNEAGREIRTSWLFTGLVTQGVIDGR